MKFDLHLDVSILSLNHLQYKMNVAQDNDRNYTVNVEEDLFFII